MATHAAEVKAVMIRRIPVTFAAGIVAGQDTLDKIVGVGPIIRENWQEPGGRHGPGREH